MNTSQKATLQGLGYRMPAEWEQHEATLIAWPHNRSDWPGKFAPIPWAFVEMVRVLHAGERVRILVKDESYQERAQRMLAKAHVDLGKVDFYRIPTDRSWTRDFAPLIVTSTRRDCDHQAVKWQFTAWAKYSNFSQDEAAGQEIARQRGYRTWMPTMPSNDKQRVVLEGGSIDVNGKGTLLTSEECLLSKEAQVRNPGLDKEGYECLFAEHLGASNTVWIPYGIEGDDTNGHIDDLARFVNERTVVAVLDEDKNSPNYDRLQENFKRLRDESRDQDGHSFVVLPLPVPERRLFDNVPLPMSYANFYIGNSAVLMPTFNDVQDKKALDVLSQVFDRPVIGIYAGDLVWGFGTIHCLTQQEPK